MWRLGRRSGVWPYSEISAIRLSYRPVWLQAHRFRADIRHSGGARLSMLSTSWQTAALMKPQDHDYRAFITKLHARLAIAGTKARFEGGLGRKAYAAALVLLAFIGFAVAGLVVRALVTGQFAGALFLTGFAALFAWQVGGFVRRNRPLAYDLEHLPQALLP